MSNESRGKWGALDVLESILVITLLALPVFYVPGWSLPYKSALAVFHLIQLGLCVRSDDGSGYMVLLTFLWDALLLGTQYLLYVGYLSESFYGLNVNTNDTYKEFVKMGTLALGLFVSLGRGLNLFTRADMMRREEMDRERLAAKRERLAEVAITSSHPTQHRRKVIKTVSANPVSVPPQIIYMQAPMNPMGGYQMPNYPNYYTGPPTANAQRMLTFNGPYG